MTAEQLARRTWELTQKLGVELGQPEATLMPWVSLPPDARGLRVLVAERLLEEINTGGRDPALGALARTLVQEWRVECGHERATVDRKRVGKVAARLREADSPDQGAELVRRGIAGAKRFPYVTRQGRASTGIRRERFDDIELICRDASHLERFAAMAGDDDGPSREKLVGV